MQYFVGYLQLTSQVSIYTYYVHEVNYGNTFLLGQIHYNLFEIVPVINI